MTALDRRRTRYRPREKNRTRPVRLFSANTPSGLCLFALIVATGAFFSGCLPKECVAPTALGNLGHQVNSPWDDYAPVLPDTATLIFTSDRVRSEESGLRGTYSGQRPAHLLLTMRLGTSWDEAQKYEILFGKGKDVEIATITFPPVPNTLNALAYVTSCEVDDRTCDIYVVSGGGTEGLTNPGPGLNSDGWDGLPFVTADGSRLYFSSIRSGGYGGTDIWYVERDPNGLWGRPLNAGATVNGPGDELSPFVDPETGTLYFASSTPDNGLDLFRLQPDASQRTPLPSPYNSPADDFTPFLKEGKLYLSSNREGGCGGYDLYAFPMAR